MRTFLACALIVMCVAPVRSQAIELHPSAQQVATALERGQTAATARTPPVELYSWFGPPRDDANEFRPRGFLMTKLSGLAVLSAHFALRAQQPNDQEIRRILDDQYLQVSVTLYGDRRDFAQKDRKSTRLNSSHLVISYAVFCLKKKKTAATAYTAIQT